MRHAFTLLSVLLAACASQRAQSPDSGTTQRTVRVVGTEGTLSMATVATPNSAVAALDAPPDRVWALLPAVYQELGLDFTTLDPSRRLIGNDGLVVRRKLKDVPLTRYLNCGGGQEGPNAARYDVTMSIFTRLSPTSEGGTSVATMVGALARSPLFTNSVVNCSSTRRLEDRIATLLRVKLEG